MNLPDIEPLPPEDARRRAEFRLGGSETPRTDGAAYNRSGSMVVPASVSCQLELELSRAQALLYRMARWSKNPEELRCIVWHWKWEKLLAELRAMDEERYGREVK